MSLYCKAGWGPLTQATCLNIGALLAFPCALCFPPKCFLRLLDGSAIHMHAKLSCSSALATVFCLHYVFIAFKHACTFSLWQQMTAGYKPYRL